MATPRGQETMKLIPTTAGNDYASRTYERPARNPIFFPAILVGLQAIFILLMGLHGDYGIEADPTIAVKAGHEASHKGIEDYYSMFQDIHVMIFIGFGFLMTFLRRYGFSAVGYNFLVAAFVLEWAIIVRGYLFDFNTETQMFPVDVKRLVIADFVAASVLISFGAVIGKINPTQLIVMALIEVALQSVNEFIGARRFCAYDIGESMFVHVFGAYFGLAVSFMLYDKALLSEESEKREKSVYHSDLFAMIGTLFLFCFWPSFNGGVASAGEFRLRALVNTYLSIVASVLLTYVCSCLFSKDKKFDMVHIQNATLAGGVAVGTVADKMIRPFGAMLIGSTAGILATVGFRFIKPALQKLHIHDTCGVNNLHGMPGLLAGFFGIVLAFLPSYSLYITNIESSCWNHQNRTSLGQVGYQASALGVTVALAIGGGLVTGFILRLPGLNDDRPSSYYNDHIHWETPEDFHDDASTPSLHTEVEDRPLP